MKQIMRLSDRILKLDTDFIARISTHPSDKPSTEVSFSKEPSYTTSDKLEYEIKQMFPIRNELYMFLKILLLDPDYISDTIYYKPEYSDISDKQIRPGELATLSKYQTDRTAWLEVIVNQESTMYLNRHYKDRTDFYKHKIMPHLTTKNYLYIRPSNDKHNYSDILSLKLETIHSLETETYYSLKSNSYDLITFPLIIDNAFNYSDYTAIKCRGRDSASIQWNSLFVLTALHCLKKGGNLQLLFYGNQSFIVCQFISFVSTLFSEVIILDHTVEAAYVTTNNMKILFRGYNKITATQKETLLNWYNSRKLDMYYSDLGVSCNPVLQDKLNHYSTIREKNIKLLKIIADKYRHILDASTPSEKDSIIDYIIKQRHINYFIQAEPFLR